MSGTVMALCPSCGRPQKTGLLCAECGAPLEAELDYFAALGLPRLLTIDLAELERTYHELGRRIHPDRFANQPAAVRAASLKGTALLTRSYRTLRGPVARGLYWLELHGQKLAENNKAVPPELAELVFEVQEQLAELREAGEGRNELVEEVRQRRADVQQLMNAAHIELQENFEQWSSAIRSSDDASLIVDLKKTLSKIAYLRTLLRDTDRELEPANVA